MMMSIDSSSGCVILMGMRIDRDLWRKAKSWMGVCMDDGLCIAISFCTHRTI